MAKGEYEEFPRRCAQCGEENPREFPVCWNCQGDLADAVELPRAPEVEPAPNPSPVDPSIRFGIGFEVLVVLALVWLPGVVAGVESYFTPFGPLTFGDELDGVLINAAEILLIVYLLWRTGSLRDQLGLQRSKIWREVGWGLGLAAAGFVVMNLPLAIVPDWFWAPATSTSLEFAPDDVALGWLLPWSFLVAALEEEVIFRAYLWRRLTQLFGDPILALLASAAFFALAHVAVPVDTLAHFAFGLLFGWVFLRTGILWLLVLGHWFYNLAITYV